MWVCISVSVSVCVYSYIGLTKNFVWVFYQMLQKNPKELTFWLTPYIGPQRWKWVSCYSFRALFHHNAFMSTTTDPTTGGARRTNLVMWDQKVETFNPNQKAKTFNPTPWFLGRREGLEAESVTLANGSVNYDYVMKPPSKSHRTALWSLVSESAWVWELQGSSVLGPKLLCQTSPCASLHLAADA